MSRRCNIPPTSCAHKYAAPCCRDCAERKRCPAACQNHPDRCRCWSDKPGGSQARGPRWRKVNPEQAVRLYQQGWSVARLAEKYACAPHTVEKYLKEAGVMKRA